TSRYSAPATPGAARGGSGARGAINRRSWRALSQPRASQFFPVGFADSLLPATSARQAQTPRARRKCCALSNNQLASFLWKKLVPSAADIILSEAKFHRSITSLLKICASRNY